MTLAPRSSLAPNHRHDQLAIAALEETGDREASDTRLTPEERRTVRQLLALLDPILSDEAFMFLAGGAEDAALRKRSREGRSAS